MRHSFNWTFINPNPTMIFLLESKGESVIVLAYVDDLLITDNNIDTINLLKRKLSGVFNIKDLGTIKYFLGLEFIRISKGMYIRQRKICPRHFRLYKSP